MLEVDEKFGEGIKLALGNYLFAKNNIDQT
jgi:hypothetical protein